VILNYRLPRRWPRLEEGGSGLKSACPTAAPFGTVYAAILVNKSESSRESLEIVEPFSFNFLGHLILRDATYSTRPRRLHSQLECETYSGLWLRAPAYHSKDFNFNSSAVPARPSFKRRNCRRPGRSGSNRETYKNENRVATTEPFIRRKFFSFHIYENLNKLIIFSILLATWKVYGAYPPRNRSRKRDFLRILSLYTSTSMWRKDG